ncbi:hypothetical protein C0995_009397 [Termitomyces sp. Mi166|nr:hypothetical protein C0995_009397 [Termitomyces sp. Mi166\
MPRISFLVNVLLLAGNVLGATYSQTESIQGYEFLQAFSYQTIPDPTMGRVNYVDGATAWRENLTFASGDHFVVRSDFKKRLSATGPGRDSMYLRRIDFQGEIDILEGVNDQTPNQSTLHTGNGGENLVAPLLRRMVDMVTCLGFPYILLDAALSPSDRREVERYKKLRSRVQCQWGRLAVSGLAIPRFMPLQDVPLLAKYSGIELNDQKTT